MHTTIAHIVSERCSLLFKKISSTAAAGMSMFSCGNQAFLIKADFYYRLVHKNKGVLKLRSNRKYRLQWLFMSEMIKTPHVFPIGYQMSSCPHVFNTACRRRSNNRIGNRRLIILPQSIPSQVFSMDANSLKRTYRKRIKLVDFTFHKVMRFRQSNGLQRCTEMPSHIFRFNIFHDNLFCHYKANTVVRTLKEPTCLLEVKKNLAQTLLDLIYVTFSCRGSIDISILVCSY